MTTQWDRWRDRATQSLADLGWEQTIEIYNGTGAYTPPSDTTADQRSGDTYSYPDTATATLDAAVMPPSAIAGVDDAGTFEGVDQVAFIDEDDTTTINTYGDPDTPPSRVVWLDSGETYEVESVTVGSDGLKRLDMVEP